MSKTRGFGVMVLSEEGKKRQSEIAQLGGKRAHELGKAHAWNSETGRTAGLKAGAIAKTKGTEYFKELGRKGAAAVAKKYGPNHFRELGRKGGAASHAKPR